MVFSLQIELKASICEAIYTYDVIQKRKPYLDQIMEGLQDFQLSDLLKMFPSVFEPVFVNNGKCDPFDVVNILDYKPSTELSREEARVLDYLKRFLTTECSKKGKVKWL